MGTQECFFHVTCCRCRAGRLVHVCYLGLPIRCRHCGATFSAADVESRPVPDPIRYDLEFSEALRLSPEFEATAVNRPK